MVIFARKKLFQTNKYSQFSLIISTLKKNKINFQVKENDIHARYGAYWLLIKQLYLIYLEKQISFIPFMSKKRIMILHHSSFIH